MILILHKTNDPANTINKTLYESVSIDITVRADFDVINPVIYLAGISVSEYNYCEIPDLGRSYFIDNVEAVNSQIIMMNCSVDVLESYKDQYMTSVARYKRSIRTGDYYDATIDANVNKSSVNYQSDKGLSGDPTLIMTTLGT